MDRIKIIKMELFTAVALAYVLPHVAYFFHRIGANCVSTKLTQLLNAYVTSQDVRGEVDVFSTCRSHVTIYHRQRRVL